MEGAGYDVDYTTQFLEDVDVIPELQNIQVHQTPTSLCRATD